jgi:hypothetical protein
VLFVTNTNISGPGSLQAALNTPGPRYILFRVGGVIPGTVEVPIGNGNFTLAGQTAPGGIIVRGFSAYNDENPTAENLIIRHLRSRIGDETLYPTSNWIAGDGLTLGGVSRAIIDHCSFAHANDEAIDISRSSKISIQYCMLAETLGGHAYLGGMLINYSAPQSRLDSLSIHHNLWNRVGGRMPELSCESPYCNGKTVRIEYSHNLLWDQQIQVYYDPASGPSLFYLHANFIGNLSVARPDYGGPLFNYNFLSFPQNTLFVSDNSMQAYPNWKDYDLFYCCNDFNTEGPNTDPGLATRRTARFDFPPISNTPTGGLKNLLTEKVGAFPRDSMDRRLLKPVIAGWLDPTPLDLAAANDPFLVNAGVLPEDVDNDGMPDTWEVVYGTNPQSADHNGLNLSATFTGIEGYTNLECYLNNLSDALVQGTGCQTPQSSQFKAAGITTTSAVLYCAAPGTQNFDWRYRKSGAAQWIELPATNTDFYPLNNLTPNTSYEFQCAVRCNTWSGWSVASTFMTSVNTAVDEIPALENWQVSPNPTSGNLSVQWTLQHPANCIIQVIDRNNLPVLKTDLGRLDARNHQTFIDLSPYPAGNYLIGLTINELTAWKNMSKL